MDRKKATDFHPDVLKLFDGYVHGAISRREFLDRAAKYAVGGVTALGLLEMLSPNFAWAQQVKKDDPRIRAEYAEYHSPKGSGRMRGYLARPARAGKAPGIAVIHENRGLSPYTEDVARRLAVEGYVAFAPDALTPLGGYPGDEEKGRALFAQLDTAKRMEDMLASCAYLARLPECNGRLGAVGFCDGGTVVNTMATRLSDLSAAAPFYGRTPNLEDVSRIKAAVQAHLASSDERINAAYPAYEAALKAAGARYEVHTYPGTQHGFHNDTTPRYDEAAAKLAWTRTLGWFGKHLA